MVGEHTRRRVLGGAVALSTAPWWASGATVAGQEADGDGFAPTRNAYGFRNWSPKDQYFEAPPDPSPAEVRERVRTGWRGRSKEVLGLDTGGLSRELIESIAAQLRQAVVQRAGTNGHCYGMVLTAQRYYERPDEIPVDRPTASDIEHPTVPIEEPSAPVYDEIVSSQADQYLRFRAWLGRRAMLYPEWIDTEAVLRDVRAVVETFGSAALVLFDGSLYSHQVLAYGFDEGDAAATVSIYDPNRAAPTYRNGLTELQFDRAEGTPTMEPYGQYTGVLFNRYDRIERATERENASPLDHLTVGRSVLRASLFPHVLVMVDSAAVELSVVAPDGTTVDRIRGAHMDRSRGDFDRIRSLYGAAPGTYRVGVFGNESADYELTVTVADEDGPIVDETRSASIAAGELHEYDLEVPGDGEGEVARGDGDWPGSGFAAGAGVVGGVAAGALGYRAVQRRRRREPPQSPDAT